MMDKPQSRGARRFYGNSILKYLFVLKIYSHPDIRRDRRVQSDVQSPFPNWLGDYTSLLSDRLDHQKSHLCNIDNFLYSVEVDTTASCLYPIELTLRTTNLRTLRALKYK